MARDQNEADYVELWKKVNPVRAYTNGLDLSLAGQVFQNSKSNIHVVLQSIRELQQRIVTSPQQNPNLFKYLDGIHDTLLFEEPFNCINIITNGIFSYLLNQAPPDALRRFIQNAKMVVSNSSWRLSHLTFTMPQRVLTQFSLKGLFDMLQTLQHQPFVDVGFLSDIERLKTEATLYKGLFRVPVFVANDPFVDDSYENIMAVFDEYAKTHPPEESKMGRIFYYERILKTVYDYEETTGVLLAKAFQWLQEELGYIQVSIDFLSKKYNVQNRTIEGVADSLAQLDGVPINQLVALTKTLQDASSPNNLLSFFNANIATVPPPFSTASQIIETPGYLTPSIPCAAMTGSNEFTKNPILIYFVTTDPKLNPMDNMPDLINTYVHENMGHALHMYQAIKGNNAPLVDMLDNTFTSPISEGIAFNRELEFQIMLDRGLANKEIAPSIPLIIRDRLEELRFVMRKQRITRFLRIIVDVLINLDIMTLPQACQWVERTVGISAKNMYFNIFPAHEQNGAGYATSYAKIGNDIRKLQIAFQLFNDPKKLKIFSDEAMLSAYLPTSRFIGRLANKAKEITNG